VRRFSWPGWALVLGVVLLVFAAVLYAAPSDQYLFLPGQARAVAPLVDVRGERPDRDGGGIYYVAVDVRQASVLEELLPGLHDGATLVPEHLVNPRGVDEKVRRRAELREMSRSQRYAAAVALRALGYTVRIEPVGARVTRTVPGFPAVGKLRANDLIVAADGDPVTMPDDLTRLIGRRRPGDLIRLRVRRGVGDRVVVVRTAQNPDDRSRPFLGLLLADPKVTLPVHVKIDIGNVGGPSAGLAFALDLVEELGRDADHGRRVAATGEIRLDGTVHEVGGLKQKTIAARRSGMDVFLVPGENAPEARRYAEGLRIMPVDSFQQALRALATLPAAA
jgi:PDZ domain-containing protein